MNDLTPQEPRKLPKLAGKEADPEKILEDYLAGKKTEEIAERYGVTRQGLGYWLRNNAENQWKEAQVTLAIERKEKAEDEFKAIRDEVDGADKDQRDRLQLRLSLARESLKAAQWDLERVCRRIYGDDKVALNINGQAGMTVQLVSFTTSPSSQPVIEGQSKREIDVTP